MKHVLKFFLPALVASLPFASPARARASWESMPLRFVVLDAASGDVREFVRRLEKVGGHASVVWPPHSALVYADEAVLEHPSVRSWVAEAHAGDVVPEALAGRGGDVVRAARVWNVTRTLRAEMAGDAHEAGTGEALPDAGPRPVALGAGGQPQRIAVSNHLPLGAEYYDTSEFMAGSTAVGVWLLEAAGSTYDWTPVEETASLAGVQAGLDRWVQKGGAPTFLTFYLDVHTQVPVSGVPIEDPMSMDQVWVNEVLGNLGWTGGNGFEKCFAYNNALRDTYNTNWCASIFIVDSNPSVNQGLFAGGGYAWAFYGGPWVYMSRVSTWAFNSARYHGVVPMHEMGHIFMDTDEYDAVVQTQGYLNAPDHPSSSVVCIMNRNDSTRVCQPTRDQLGWRDLDLDGIIEVLDVPPAAALTPYAPDPTPNPTPTWSGTASISALDNLNPASNYFPPHDQTIATVATVEMRVDAGPWSPAAASDGGFDDYVESFAWTAPPLADGVHVVEARATTSVGTTSAVAVDTVTITGSPVSVPRNLAGGPVTLDASIPSPLRGGGTLSFTVPAASQVRLRIHGPDGRLVRLLFDGVAAAGRTNIPWDGRTDGGHPSSAGVYFAQLHTSFGIVVRRLALTH